MNANQVKNILSLEGRTYITDPEISEALPHKYLLQLSMVWVSILILGFFTSLKTFDVFGVTFFVAAIAYPFTYIFNDMFTEVYGYRVSRKIIWTGLLSVIFITSLASLYTYIPSGKDFDPLSEQAFNRIFRASPLVALAGALSFFLGEYTNSVWLAKMKVWTNGKWEAFRCITSTLFGQIVDNTLFALVLSGILQYFSFDVAISGIISTVLFCTLWEILAFPLFTQPLIKWLKEKEGIDTYDRSTRFSIV